MSLLVERLERFYTVHNPAKLADKPALRQLATTFDGRERALNRALWKSYKHDLLTMEEVKQETGEEEQEVEITKQQEEKQGKHKASQRVAER